MCSNRGTLVFVSVFSATLSIPSAAVANFVPGQGAIGDTLTNRQILLEMLTNWHATPSSAESGARAITVLRAAQGLERIYRFILVNAQMPEMDGFALADA